METIKGSQPPETNIILRGDVSDDKLVCADWVVKAGGYMYVYAYIYIYICIFILREDRRGKARQKKQTMETIKLSQPPETNN